MNFLIKISFLSVVLGSFAFGMGGSGAGGASVAGAYRDVKDVTGLINTNSPEATKLRTNLSMLSAKLNSLGGATPGQLGDRNKAQSVAGTIDSVVNTLIGTSVLSSVQSAEALKGSISHNQYLQALFINQGGNVSVWEAYIYPNVLTTLIRIQASYAAAIVNYVSQHIDRLKKEEIDSLNATVQSMLNRLNSIV